MNIGGLQKLTLLDYPNKVACTIFTVGCNLRCPFCHNAALIPEAVGKASISEEDLGFFLKKRRSVLDGVVISGGEPLLQPDLPDFLKNLKDLGYAVKLDTNGTFPARLQAVCEAGLVDYVAMDVKSSPGRYDAATGLSELDYGKIRESVDFLLHGQVPYEFRTTVVGGLHDETVIKEIAVSITGAKKYYLQQFVDSGNLPGADFFAFSEPELSSFLKIVSPFVEFAALRGV